MNAPTRRVAGAAFVVLAVLTSVAVGESAPRALVPASAVSLGQAPVSVTGTASARKREKHAPVPGCAAVDGVQWYTLSAPHRGPMVARLIARDSLDAAIVVYRIVRSQRLPVLCARTNRHGRARAAWYAYADGAYLLGVARRAGAASGRFTLAILAAERAPHLPGDALPADGARSTINPVLDATDAWAVPMARGIPYRINLTKQSRTTCIAYELYGPHTSSLTRGTAVLTRDCGGYTLFTPGPDGGGVYSLVVHSGPGDPVDHAYRVQVAPAGPDDIAPGLKLENGQVASGSLFGRGIDAVDLYRFAVPREGELTTLELNERANVGFDLLVLDETGKRVASIKESRGRQELRLHLHAGRYYAALRSRNGNGGAYVLQVRVRDVTSTSIGANNAQFTEVPPNAAVPLTVHVTAVSHGGRVVVQIDHFDPLSGWQFATYVPGRVDASGTFTTAWLPPSVGHWRARARFLANPYSSFSESGYVHLHVVEPLE
jgi:hypothetical protein